MKKLNCIIIIYIQMIKRSKIRRSKNALFNPYKNGISTYDMTYLSSKKVSFKNKTIHLQSEPQKDFAA